MKYLKAYNESNSSQDYKSTIDYMDDLSLDINDMGHNVTNSYEYSKSDECFQCVIENHKNLIYFNDVKDFFTTLESYFKSMGYKGTLYIQSSEYGTRQLRCSANNAGRYSFSDCTMIFRKI